MIGPIVPPLQPEGTQNRGVTPFPSGMDPSLGMDPLSQVLALMKPQVYVAGGFAVLGNVAVAFPKHQGIKCYAMLAGECWLAVEDAAEPVRLHAGDCFLLPRGLPFRLTTDLSLEPLHYQEAFARFGIKREAAEMTEGARYIAGGHFALTGSHAEMLLELLPPIVHIRREEDKAAMRWSIERMRAELNDPKPGSSLIMQHLAYTMVIQALRLHLTDAGSAGGGWLSALSDKQMGVAVASIHHEPGYPWTLQSLAERAGMSRSVFALRFRETVGITPMDYLARWRMMLAADRLENSSDGLSTIAQSLGYESESAFGKAFRRIMGCSPRRYTRTNAGRGMAVKHGAEEQGREAVVGA